MSRFSHSSPISQAGFTMIPNAVMLRGDLTPTAKIVYGYLKHLAWRESGDVADPPIDTIAADLHLSARAVQDALAALRKAPVIADGDPADGCLVKSVRRGQGKTNAYVINDPRDALEEPRPTLRRQTRSAKNADQERQDPPHSARARSSSPNIESKPSGAIAPAPEEDDDRTDLEVSWPPPLPKVFLEPRGPGERGLNRPLQALLDECGIDEESRLLKLAATCLNGRPASKTPDGEPEKGIRHLCWIEFVRYAEATGRRDELRAMTPKKFADLLAERIRLKARLYREAWPGITLGPKGLADHWLDLERRREERDDQGPRRMSGDEFVRLAREGA